jgi:hypothetical protein
MKLAEKQQKVSVSRSDSKRRCVHDYILDTPKAGKTVKGCCRKCQRTGRFLVAVEDMLLPGRSMGYRTFGKAYKFTT